MAKMTLNGKEVEVREGANLVDAAEEHGVEIPHYCYHPGLSIAGQCRMCVVEVEGNPRPQIACNTLCKDGMKVTTNSPKVEEIVKANLELHLINHPIDCPICDQAGECGLQDYYMKHGKYESEMREHKVNKKKVVDLGDHVMLDKERCILCGRCVRFTQEVSKTADLAVFNRGDRSVVGTVNDEPMKGNYQVNTVDICPVGALTSKDFRFEQRVWFLDEASSVCGGCSMGCNVRIDHKKGKHIYRLKPRYNEKVNGHWMCDVGRYTYKDSNFDRRLTSARLGGLELSSRDALQTWATELKALAATERSNEVGIWINSHLTNEEAEVLLDFISQNLSGAKLFGHQLAKAIAEDQFVDGLLYRSDQAPNSRGVQASLTKRKVSLGTADDLAKAVTQGQISHVVLLVPEGAGALTSLTRIAQSLTMETYVVVVTPQLAAVDLFPQALAVPSISHYEKSGTIVNHAGLHQKLSANFRMFKESRSLQEIFQDLQLLQRGEAIPERQVG